jgi:hypothetical protein
MQKWMIVAAAVVLVVTGIVVMLKADSSSATQASPASVSSFDLMSNAKGLPVAPHSDAF